MSLSTSQFKDLADIINRSANQTNSFQEFVWLVDQRLKDTEGLEVFADCFRKVSGELYLIYKKEGACTSASRLQEAYSRQMKGSSGDAE